MYNLISNLILEFLLKKKPETIVSEVLFDLKKVFKSRNFRRLSKQIFYCLSLFFIAEDLFHYEGKILQCQNINVKKELNT